MVQGYCDFLDMLPFEEQVGPFPVLCTTVYYHNFRGPELAIYLHMKEVCNFLRCTLF